MTTELPSINSSTSISDNVDLRNYYDKLLFKNNSGKSLTDLPRKATLAAAAAANSANNFSNNVANGGDANGRAVEKNELAPGDSQTGRATGEQKMDFINGYNNQHVLRNGYRLPFTSFQMTPSNSEPTPPSMSLPVSQTQPLLQQQQLQNHHNQHHQLQQQQQQQPIFNFDNGMSPGYQQTGSPNNIPPFAFDFDQSNNSQSSYYLGSLKPNYNSIETGAASMNSLSLEDPTPQQLPGARRSSYISDTLIHGQLGTVPNKYSNPMFNTGTMNGAPKTIGYSGAQTAHNQMGLPPQPPPTAPAIPYGNSNPGFNQQRRHTQPINSLTAPSTANGGYSQAQVGPGISRNRYLNYSKQQQQSQDSSESQLLLDNGLILINAQKLVSSKDLQALYADCGTNYFSSKPVFEFTDRMKSLLGLTGNADQNDKQFLAVSKFLAFLKSCNLNYNPQSDAFLATDTQISPKNHAVKMDLGANDNSTPNSSNMRERRSNSTSSYLHYKPLVLVALKNGKLELLSTPQNTNISMRRGDLVIIDGDRGKDLALVVEPVVDLDFALFVNFLKKKIHFDSLITSKSQHHSNRKFIQALTDSTKGQGDELNSKLYDVIELTQLIVPSKQVLRFATTWEVTTNLHNKFQDELKALHIAQLKLKSLNSGFTHHHNTNSSNYTSSPNNGDAAHASNGSARPQLNIKILNAEFQFDRKKLTFYYVCEERNDFRELIKELFKFYKTRIWLCAIPNNLGIDSKYYDSQRKEFQMYQEMMQHYAIEDLTDANTQQGGGFIVAPPLNKIELDNFQIGVYKELVDELFES